MAIDDARYIAGKLELKAVHGRDGTGYAAIEALRLLAMLIKADKLKDVAVLLDSGV